MRLFLFLITFAFSFDAIARPVSYPTGWTIMQNNDMDVNSLHIHYSPTAKYSIGYKGEYWREGKNQLKWQFHGAQINYLVKRWNKPASQANFYFKNAIGIAYANYQNTDSQTEPGGFTGLAFDWENRRYFTSYENKAYYLSSIDKFFVQKARVGIAPYIGDYGDIHTWIMLQADHQPEAKDNIIITPLLRFFKDEYLTEIGVSEDGDALFNFIIRF